MKTLIVLLLVGLSLDAFAMTTGRDINRAMNEVATFLEGSPGIVGIDASDCGGEACIVIYAQTKKAASALKTLFPVGKRYDNILIAVSFMGQVGTPALRKVQIIGRDGTVVGEAWADPSVLTAEPKIIGPPTGNLGDWPGSVRFIGVR
jgi:hypothetical protein